MEWPLFTALSSFSRDNYVFAWTTWTTWTTLKNVGSPRFPGPCSRHGEFLDSYKKGAFPRRIVRADGPVTRLASVPGLRGIHDTLTRATGDRIFVEFHLEVDCFLPVDQGHGRAARARPTAIGLSGWR